jgi:hypothetical protein
MSEEQIKDYSAELYKTVLKFNPTPVQKQELNAWAGVQNTTKRLLSISNQDVAYREFSKLDEDIQDIIASQNPDAPFTKSNLERKGKVRAVLDGISRYAQSVTGIYRAGRVAQQENISYAAAWEKSKDGEAIFDRDRVSKVDSYYPKAVAKIAKMKSMGKSDGEVLANINLSDPEEYAAFEDYINLENSTVFQQALKDYSAAKISPGRDIAYRMFDVDPGEFGLNRKAYSVVSGGIDLAQNIIFDPLTYVALPFQAFKLGVLSITRIARAAEAAGKVGSQTYKVALDARIDKAFDNPVVGGAVRRYFDEAGKQIEKYATGNSAQKAEAFSVLNRQFREISQQAVEEFAKRKVFNANAARDFLKGQQNLDLILNGRKVFGKDVLPTYSIFRGYKNDVRNSLLRATGIGLAKGGGTAARLTAETLENTLARADFIENEATRNQIIQGFKDSATKASKLGRLFEIAPSAKSIQIGKRLDEATGRMIDDGLKSTKDIISLGRFAGLSRPDADELGRLWTNASVAQRKNIHKGLYFAVADSLGMFQGLQGDQILTKLDDILGSQEYALDQVINAKSFKQLPQTTQKAIKNSYGANFKAALSSGVIRFNPSKMASNKSTAAMEHQLSFELRTPDLRALQAEVYSNNSLRIRSFGQVFNNKFNEGIVNAWAFLTLVPRLGIRSAIEEIMLFGLIATPKTFINLINYGFRSSRAVRRVLENDTRFFDSKGVGAPTRAFYALFRPGLNKKLVEKANANPTAENIAEVIGEATVAARGKLPFVKNEQQFRDNIEDFYKYEYGKKSYEETTMSATLGTNIKGAAYKGYGSQADVSKIYGDVQSFSLNQKKFEKSFVAQGKAIPLKVQSEPDAYYMGLAMEMYKRAALGNTSRIAIQNIQDPAKAIRLIKKELDTNKTLNDSFVNSMGQTVDSGQLATSIFYSTRQVFVNKSDEVNMDLIKLVYSNGKWTPDIDMTKLKAMNVDDLPTTLLTQKWIPVTENYGGWFKAISQKGYDWMDRQIATLTREPIYHANYQFYRNEYKVFQNARKQELLNKGFSEKAADNLSRQYASNLASDSAAKRTLDYVDNPLVRTNLAFNLRNFARFYRATEDFWRRAYRAVTKDTQSLVRLRLASQGLEHSGFVHEDENGELYFVFPGDDIIYNAVSIAHRFINGKSNLKLPMPFEFTGKIKMISPSLDPESSIPTLSGPIAGISMVVLQQHAPNFWGIRDSILGVTLGQRAKDSTYRDVILPPGVKRALSFLNTNDLDSEMASAQRVAYTILVNNGQGLKVDATPEEKKEFEVNLEALASNILVTRFVLGLFSPVSPTLGKGKDVSAALKEQGTVTWRDEFYKTVDELAAQGVENPYEEAINRWTKYKPGILAYTVSESERTTVASIQRNEIAANWIRKNDALMKKYPEGAAFFVPSVFGFDLDESRFFQREGYFEKIPVEDFIIKVTAAFEENEYFKLSNEWDEKIDTAAESIKPILRQQKAEALSNFKENKYYLEKALEDFGSKADLDAAWEDVGRMIDNGDVPNTKDAPKIVEIYELTTEAYNMTELMIDGTKDADIRKKLIRQGAFDKAMEIASGNPSLERLVESLVKKKLGVQ